jgi:hypothetical protein
MIDLEYIVKTSLLMPLLKRIISIFLIILLLAEFVLLVLKVSEFSILLDRFLTMQYNFSLYYWFGVIAVNYLFFYFLMKLIMKILDFYDNWR